MIAACSAASALAQALQVSLATSAYNGYHISCFGFKDGAIDATVSGGTPPYSFAWTNGSTTEDIAELPSGYYAVEVMDADSARATAHITLLEPIALKLDAQASTYPNGYNISCHECYNGSITASALYGVPPYAFIWNDGSTEGTRNGLGSIKYAVKVTDANGCEASSETIYLTQPESKDWKLGGNAGSDASLSYIGTTDAQDVVFKSNDQERLRLLGDGSIKLFGEASQQGPLYLDADGTLRIGGFNEGPPPYPGPDCLQLHTYPYWRSNGNSFPANLCPNEAPILGTRTAHPLRVYTDDIERMIVTVEGKVGIGATPPAGPIDGYRLYVGQGIATRDVLVKNGAWPDYVFDETYRLQPMSELRAYLQRNRHLPGIPSAREVEEKGGVEVGDLQRRMLEVMEQQALYILQLEERLARVEQRMGNHEASKR